MLILKKDQWTTYLPIKAHTYINLLSMMHSVGSATKRQAFNARRGEGWRRPGGETEIQACRGDSAAKRKKVRVGEEWHIKWNCRATSNIINLIRVQCIQWWNIAHMKNMCTKWILFQRMGVYCIRDSDREKERYFFNVSLMFLPALVYTQRTNTKSHSLFNLLLE